LDRVVDELGLVLEGEHLSVFIPATQKAFVFRVKSRHNRGFERIHYGPLPLPANVMLASFLGGGIQVPVAGVLPGTAFIPSGAGISFPLTGVFDEADMWFLPPEFRERLFHVKLDLTPRWLRVDLEIPRGVSQRRFQRDKVTLGVEKLFGFSRGHVEVIHFPGIHYGYRFANDSNLHVFTGVDFTYGEYVVEIPKDAELIFNILTRRVPSLFLTMPITVFDESIRRAFLDTYGIEGFPLFPITKKADAIAEYERLLREVKI
jgi:hypothetical protein